MNDDVLSKKLEELATKKDIEQLKSLVNSLHEQSTFKIKRLFHFKKSQTHRTYAFLIWRIESVF